MYERTRGVCPFWPWVICFLVLSMSTIPFCMHHIFKAIHLLTRHSGWVHCLATVKRSAVNTGASVFVVGYLILGVYPRVVGLGHMVSLHVAFCRTSTLIPIVMHQSTLPPTVSKGSFPVTLTASAIISFLDNSHTGWVRRNFKMVSVCISLMA